MNPKDQAIKRSKESLFFFAKHILGFKDITKRTHGEIIDVLESPSKRKLIVCPRGSLKSSLCCVGAPLWFLLNDPNHRILLDSELFGNSSTFIREIKAHIKSPIFRYLFGNWQGDLWTQSEITVRGRTKNYKEASISSGGIGTTRVGQHHSIIIGDDYNSPNNSNSIENANKVIQHFRYNFSILEPQGTFIVVGTRYSSNDVIGHILDTHDHDHKGDDWAS